VSLKTGDTILKTLSKKYRVGDILIDKEGTWHHQGVPKEPQDLFYHFDVFVNALHGEYGEDGKVQKLFEIHNVPFTGAGSLGSAMAMNKILAKDVYENHGIKTPIWKILRKDDYSTDFVRNIFLTFPHPCVVKPAGSGSSLGISIAKSLKELYEAVDKAFEYDDNILFEEYIKGKEATCGVIDDFRGVKDYSLLPVEIRIPSNTWFDYDSKYSGETDEICPGNFSREECAIIQAMANRAHKALNLRHYSRSDFMVHPRRGVYILETNSLPGLTQNSLFPKSLHAVGSSIEEFLDHIIYLAIK
jgi:D-alanine-D-alanine ligase